MPIPRFRPEPDLKIELGIRNQREFRRGMRDRADIAAVAVRAVAPVGDPKNSRMPGYYKRRIKARGPRVHALDVMWHLIEFGSVNNETYAPLRRGILAAGFDFKPSPMP